MTDVLTRLVVGLNAAANAVGRWVLAPVALLPGWLSATLVGAVTGVLLLAVFKYTSDQRAVKRVRDDINANLLALKLFRDSAAVAVRAQGAVLLGAARLAVLALVQMAVRMVGGVTAKGFGWAACHRHAQSWMILRWSDVGVVFPSKVPSARGAAACRIPSASRGR